MVNSESGSISIWYFVGILMTFYGVIIAGVGLYHLVTPPANPVVLSWLHADLWWGAILLAIGLLYLFKFAPKRATVSETTGP